MRSIEEIKERLTPFVATRVFTDEENSIINVAIGGEITSIRDLRVLIQDLRVMSSVPSGNVYILELNDRSIDFICSEIGEYRLNKQTDNTFVKEFLYLENTIYLKREIKQDLTKFIDFTLNN